MKGIVEVSMLNVSATSDPPWVLKGYLEGVAVLATGYLLNVDQLHLRRPCVRRCVGHTSNWTAGSLH